jgi:non-heme chloroperoxidase
MGSLGSAEPHARPASCSRHQPSTTADRLISIVDDDSSARAAVAGLVRALGFAAAEFASAGEFLRSGEVGQAKCLIADVRMPGMTGLALYRHLVASGTAIPTILMTAWPDDATRTLALNAGVICYLAKPFASGDLLGCITSAFALSCPSITTPEDPAMTTITTKDGTRIHYKDWGSGQPVVFSHGWPLSADAWEAQMVFMASNGYRAIGHDRRGHGRSSQPWHGNEMDTYADDLAELIEALDLGDIVLIGHSTGGGEITRYIGRHGTARVAKAVLVGAVPPLMVKTAANPGGLPIDVFDGLRAASLADRSQLYKDLASGPFFGFNREGAKASQGLIDAFWLQGMMGGHKNTLDCIKAFSETDFTEDLKRFDVPTLIVHGDDDQIVPIGASAHASVKLVKDAILKVYEGGSHALPDTSRDRLNADLLAFVKS